MSECDFKGCGRKPVSCGNLLYDHNGDDYDICICAYHLIKFIGEFEDMQETIKQLKDLPSYDAPSGRRGVERLDKFTSQSEGLNDR